MTSSWYFLPHQREEVEQERNAVMQVALLDRVHAMEARNQEIQRMNSSIEALKLQQEVRSKREGRGGEGVIF